MIYAKTDKQQPSKIITKISKVNYFKQYSSKLNFIEPDTIFCSQFHYMYFAMFSFWVTIIICLLLSHLTEAPEEWRAIRTTFKTRYDKRERPDDSLDNSEMEMNPIPTRLEDVKLDVSTKKTWLCCWRKKKSDKAKVRPHQKNFLFPVCGWGKKLQSGGIFLSFF